MNTSTARSKMRTKPFLDIRAKALSRFSTGQICSHEQRKKQLNWPVRNTDDITSQSHSLFACSREQIRQVENRLYVRQLFKAGLAPELAYHGLKFNPLFQFVYFCTSVKFVC